MARPEAESASALSVIGSQREVTPPTSLGSAESKTPTPERSEILTLSKSIIRITAGYDMQLRQQSDGKQFIVDLYAYRPRRYEIDTGISREEAIAHFEAHARKIDQIGLNNLPPEWEFIRDSQRALAVYLREEDKIARGEPKIPYPQYLMAVLGIEPRLIPWPELDRNWDNVVNILQRMGEKFDANNVESVREAIRRRSKDTGLNTQEQVEGVFRRTDRKNRYKLAQILEQDLRDIKFDIVWEETDAFWRFWETLGPQRDYLRANWHERHQAKFDLGLAELYGGHEPEHFIFGALIRKEVQAGRLDPAAGLLTVPGPILFQLEGLAQTIGDLAEYELSLDGELAVELYRMEKRTLNNGLFLVEMDGVPIDQAAQRMRKYTPKNAIRENVQLLREGTERPFERAYLPVYGRSDYELMQLREKIGDGIVSLLPYWHRRPLTPDQFLNPPLRELVVY